MRQRKKKRIKHFFLSDGQVKPGVPTDHFEAAGNYCAKKKPDVIIFGGDFFDMPSLSSYDKGKADAENRRYEDDIKAGIAALKRFFKGINRENNRLAKAHKKLYKPRLVYLIGNHEQRIERYAQSNPELVGKVGYKDFQLDKFGFEVYDFLEVAEIDGVLYSHFFPRNAKGRITQTKNGAPSAALQLQRERQSCTAGHMQGLDFAIHQTVNKRQYGIISGAFYAHEEKYLSPQGTQYWRGCIMKHDVHEGAYDPMFLSLDWLVENYLKPRK